MSTFTVWINDKNGNDGVLLSGLPESQAFSLATELEEQLNVKAWTERD